MPSSPVTAAVYGCEGSTLTAWERDFFAETNPLGLILFARNVETPDQVRDLVESFRVAVDRAEAPVLIDQEGGRVQRLKPPIWRQAPPAGVFGRLAARDPGAAERAVRLNARLLAHDLLGLGITVDCAPVLDLRIKGAHDVIGDRAFGEDPRLIARLGRAACEGFLDGGVIPVVKHVPGHGRAGADSHLDLPVVETPLDALRGSDFAPFRALADAPWAMTAHVVYTACDADNPATVSPRVIAEIVRGDIGFDGVLVSDDLSMRALSGDLAERTRACLAAGCDVALHCNGERVEMERVAQAAGVLAERAAARVVAGEAQRRVPSALDPLEAAEELERLISAGAERAR
jgi:beta-N-acetylhexosaminidase